MYCRNCGKKLPDDAVVCDGCGTPTGVQSDGNDQYYGQGSDSQGRSEDESYRSGYDNSYGNGYGAYGNGYDYGGPNGYGYGNGYNNGYNQYYGGGPNNFRPGGARRGFAIASMVIGIVGLAGICCSMFSMGIISILCGIAGLVFGILGMKSNARGMAVAGIVMAVLNLVSGIILFILLFSMENIMYGDMYYEFMKIFSITDIAV